MAALIVKRSNHAAEGNKLVASGNTAGETILRSSTRQWAATGDELNQLFENTSSAIKKWQEFEPAILVYKKLTESLVSETENALESITTTNWQEAERHTGSWISAMKLNSIGVRAVMESDPISTVGFENGPSLVIVFYESHSPATVPPKAPPQEPR
jgi:hypothetical protein